MRLSGMGGAGFSLIEVLVTLVIVALGLFGLAALQAKMQLSEIDSYQRAQALLLVQDMADRIAANRANAADYRTTGLPLGTGDTPATNCAAETTTVLRDRCEWSKALQGAAEKYTDENATVRLTGAMVGALGCVTSVGGGGVNLYLVTVVWAGLTPEPQSAGGNCGAGLYGTSRRALSTLVRIGTMH